MAPSRGKGRGRGAGRIGEASRPSRNQRSARNNDVKDIYQELLTEVSAAEPEQDVTARPLKRRRVAREPVDTQVSSETDEQKSTGAQQTEPPAESSHSHHNHNEPQSITEFSDSDESDYGFEDVDLGQHTGAEKSEDEVDEIADVSISLDPATTPSSKRQQSRRKPATAAEKSVRLIAHKAHVLCLLGHCIYINGWCNRRDVHCRLRPLISKKTLSYLNPNVAESQFHRNRSFIEGLEQASDTFRAHFRVTRSGLRKARWLGEREDSTPSADTEPVDREEFAAAARDLEGSQDTANQLFCALLRSAGVQARLVCSLQPLPFANPPPKSSNPQKNFKKTVYAMGSPPMHSDTDESIGDTAVQTSSTIGKVPAARRRLGQPGFQPEPTVTPQSTRKPKKPVQKLSYPVFWVEAFNAAHQKWVPVDPIVTGTINKANKLEPPVLYEPNHMLYVIAFEADGVARDVTRRYAKAYNAKTRRHRAESSEGGTNWLNKAMRVFRRRYGALDRDQVEDAELAQKEAREGLPNNVQDFKDHPYYALERHLKRHEVIDTRRREVGKVNAGTAAKPRMEIVFRREDVMVCRSADKWYRHGRVLREKELPIKHVPSRRPRGGGLHDEDENGEESSTTALYSIDQTNLYVSQPVVNGKVPRNAFGNLDIYVPSMVPAGGTHIRDQLGRQAAKILRVDCADAVTGFRFKARRGTAVLEGVIVASQHAEAMYAVIEGLRNQEAEEISMARSAVALRLWKRFLTGLRITERVRSHVGDAGAAEVNVQSELNEAEDEEEATEDAGGFFAADNDDGVAMPTAGQFSLDELAAEARIAKRQKRKKARHDSEDEEEEAPELGDDEDEASIESEADAGPIRSSERRRRVAPRIPSDGEDEVHDDHDTSGDFMMDGAVEDEDQGGGGFMMDDAEEDEDNGGGGFLQDDEEEEDRDGRHHLQDGTDASIDTGGGFVVGEDAPSQTGGGFMVDEDDAGGFMPGPLEYQLKDVEMGGSLRDDHDDLKPQITDNAEAAQDSTIAGELRPNLPDTSAVDADHTTQMEVDGAAKEPVAPKEPVDASPDGKPEHGVSQARHAPSSDKAEHGNAVSHVQQNEAAGLKDADSGQASDAASMLSHDPDDDDAEPDWLESE